MKAKKATPVLNFHNQRLFVAWSASALYEMFAIQQGAAVAQGITQRYITSRALIDLANRCHDSIKQHIAAVDTTDKAKKLQAKLKAQFTDPMFFLNAVFNADRMTVAERIATLQAKPVTAVAPSVVQMCQMTGGECTVAKMLLKKHLNLIGRGVVDAAVKTDGMHYSGVRNASIKLGNTEKETLTARAMMLRLEGAGYDRIIDGGDYVRYHHKNDERLSIIFSRAGVFVRAFAGDGDTVHAFPGA